MSIVNYSEHNLVRSHRGTMPVILTCPHDGTEAPPNVRERTDDNNPPGCRNFTASGDRRTRSITEGVAQKIRDFSGLSPYVVIALFDRKFIDANRSLSCAFIDADARPFYQEYHGRISNYTNQLLAQNSDRGFLFDIHGFTEQDDDNADIALGTGNGATLRPDFPRANIFLQHGLHGLLKSAAHRNLVYRLAPVDGQAPELGRIGGGFTVKNHPELNCIQIEIANTIRNNERKRGFLKEDLAFAIMNFVRRYAPF